MTFNIIGEEEEEVAKIKIIIIFTSPSAKILKYIILLCNDEY